MRLVPLALGCLAACGGPGAYRPPTSIDNGETGHGAFSPDDAYRPTYNRADIDKALVTEHAREASLVQQVTTLEANATPDVDDPAYRAALADLAVRRNFITALETCSAWGRDCPPRLDEPAWKYEPDSEAPPPLDASVRFDRADWIKVTAELHGRACACRTIACVDSFDALIGRLETQPTRDVQGDETATQSIVWARECLFRLRGGKKPSAVRVVDQ